MRFFTSDPHYFHKSILKFCPQRPGPTLEDMHEGLISRWNSRVTDQDTVYVLGDVFFKMEGAEGIMKRLAGRKILIRGNHDKGAQRMLDLGFAEVHDCEFIDLAGRRVLLSHYPYEHGQVPRHLEKYGPLFTEYCGFPLICGHIHGAWRTCPPPRPGLESWTLNVGVDVWDCYPVSEDVVSEYLFNPIYREASARS